MPFTLSHPAAVLPLRKYGVLSALVIGSMMPDVMYFLPFIPMHQSYGHTLPGLFFFCLPGGLLLLWLFHSLLKKPLISLFPSSQQEKLLAASDHFHFGPGKRFTEIAASIFVGAVTHVVWDSFTHSNGWGTLTIPVLRTQVTEIPGFIFMLAEILQFVSSIVGALVLLLAYRHWLRRAEEPKEQKRVHVPLLIRGLLLLGVIAGAFAPAAARLLLDPQFWLHSRRRLIGYGAIDGIKVVCLELLLFSLVWQLVVRSRRSHSPEP